MGNVIYCLYKHQAFFAEHPQYAENDFYITGESYAGHYIPAFASRVHKGNKAREGIHINFKVLLTELVLLNLLPHLTFFNLDFCG